MKSSLVYKVVGNMKNNANIKDVPGINEDNVDNANITGNYGQRSFQAATAVREYNISTVELTKTFNISLVSGSTSMISCSMADTCRKKAHMSMNKTHTQCFRWPWLSLRFESPETLVFTPVRNLKSTNVHTKTHCSAH